MLWGASILMKDGVVFCVSSVWLNLVSRLYDYCSRICISVNCFNIGCLRGCMLLMDTNSSNIQHADTIKIIIIISSQFDALNLGLSCRWFYDAPRGLFRATSDVTAWGVSKITARCHWSSVLESPFITLKSGKNDLKPSEAILCAILIAHSAHLSLHLFWGSITVYCQKLCIWLSYCMQNHASFFVLSFSASCRSLKVDLPNMVTYLIQIPIFEWYVLWCGSKNGYQKNMC